MYNVGIHVHVITLCTCMCICHVMHVLSHVMVSNSRLRMSSLLVVGARGLGAELCKNIVLAGVRRVTLLDHAVLTPADQGNRFLASSDGENVNLCLLVSTIIHASSE